MIWFYCKVPSEQRINVHGKGNYPLRSVMSPLEYLTDGPYECGPDDVNVVAFAVVAAIIGGRDAVKKFLACGIWPLNEGWEFEVERRESPILKIVVPMPKVTAIIGQQETGAAS
jgi:hypothetical protein